MPKPKPPGPCRVWGYGKERKWKIIKTVIVCDECEGKIEFYPGQGYRVITQPIDPIKQIKTLSCKCGKTKVVVLKEEEEENLRSQ